MFMRTIRIAFSKILLLFLWNKSIDFQMNTRFIEICRNRIPTINRIFSRNKYALLDYNTLQSISASNILFFPFFEPLGTDIRAISIRP